MKKFIIGLLCFIVWVILAYMIYTYYRVVFNIMLDLFGSFYVGRLIGKFVDWLCDK